MLLRKSLIFMLLITLAYTLNATTQCKNCTILKTNLQQFKENILVRRKRIVLFPKKAFVLISQAFTKAILDGRPPGISYSIEFDFYSELPDTIEAWQPTLLNQRIKAEKLQAEKEAKEAAAAAAIMAPTPKPIMEANSMNATMEDEMHDFDLEHLHHLDIDSETENHIADNELGINIDPTVLNSRAWSPFDNHLKNRYNSKRKEYEEMANFYRKHIWKSRNRNVDKTKYKHFNSYDDIQNWPPIEEEVYESAEDVPAWKYHQAYRERRNIFEQMETLGKIFNFDMKACLQRAMCEIKTNLKPYGESLMEDIVRILLTVPKKLHFKDDYFFDFTQHRSKGNPNCARIFEKTCPYRVIDFIKNALKTIKVDDVSHSKA